MIQLANVANNNANRASLFLRRSLVQDQNFRNAMLGLPSRVVLSTLTAAPEHTTSRAAAPDAGGATLRLRLHD